MLLSTSRTQNEQIKISPGTTFVEMTVLKITYPTKCKSLHVCIAFYFTII